MASSRSGAFMGEAARQSQPTTAAKNRPQSPKLPLFGTHDTSLPLNDRDRKPKFRRGGGKDPARGPESGRRPPWHGREARSDGPAILYGWHTAVAAPPHPERHIPKL